MQREGSSRRGWVVLVVMLAAGLLIFAMSMMLERNRAQTALSAAKEKLNQAHQQKTTDSGTQEALVLENEALYVALAGTEAERDAALLAQTTAEAERDAALADNASAQEQRGATLLPEITTKKTAEFSVPVGMWVLEPYAFEAAEGYLSMQQDSQGSYHFYYDDQGSTLSCAVTWLDGYHDEAAVEEMYRETAASLQAEFQLPPEAGVSELVAVQGKPAMKTILQLPDMELTVLQFCPDGVQTLVALYTDVKPSEGMGSRVMQVFQNSVEYLPDRYQ